MNLLKRVVIFAFIILNAVSVYPEQAWFNEKQLEGELHEELQVDRKNVSGQGSDFLQKTLSTIETYFKEKTQGEGILILFAMVFALGFLHATTSGHGKGILLAHMMDPDKKFLDAVKFISIFTVTHIIDIILLGTGVSFILPEVQHHEMIEAVKTVGGIGLSFFAVYLMLQGFIYWKFKETVWSFLKRKIFKKNNIIKEYQKKSKGSLLLGFLTGLAPCPFGWAIFFLMLGLNKEETMNPFMIGGIILVFGSGIFIFLLIYAILIYRGRNLLFSRFRNLEPISVFVSGFIMFLFALYYFFPAYI